MRKIGFVMYNYNTYTYHFAQVAGRDEPNCSVAFWPLSIRKAMRSDIIVDLVSKKYLKNRFLVDWKTAEVDETLIQMLRRAPFDHSTPDD